MKTLLTFVYGTSARAAVCFNSICAAVWFVLATATLFDIVAINIPRELVSNFPIIHILAGCVVFFTVFYYRTVQHRKIVFKVASLSFGSLLQAIIGSFYISNYPPFEPMFITCSLLSMWYLGAVFHVFEVEGDGNS